MLTELMSEAAEPKQVQVAITYEFIPKAQATGYKAAYMMWEDIGYPAAKEGIYSFKTRTKSVPTSGKLLETYGHVHDGGTHTIWYVNGKPACNSTQLYGRKPGFTEKADAGMGGGVAGMAGMSGAMAHISDSSVCMDFGEVKRGDKVYLEAFYNTNLHPLMIENGKAERLMGINRVYIGPTA